MLLFYWIFYQKIIFPTSGSKEVKITLNLKNFEPSASRMPSDIQRDQKALEDATRSLFDKIVSASEEPTLPVQETTKEIFEKIAEASTPQEDSLPATEDVINQIFGKTDAIKKREQVSLNSITEEALEKARLTKLEQKRLEVEKREQEALAKQKAENEAKALLALQEKVRLDTLALAVAKEKARLAKIEQKRQHIAKKKQEVLAKKQRVKKRKAKKKKLAQKRAKEKAKQQKSYKQKIAKQRRQKQKKITQRKSNDPLANAIMNSSTSMRPAKSKRPAMRMIKQFYGSEFNAFSKTQKQFIEKNLGTIYQITQRTLTRNGYPWVAQKTHQQGTAIVTFYLHPNGNITGLRLKKHIGYAALDKNTLKIIRIAYKDYPRPKTKTKITFYVEYSLF